MPKLIIKQLNREAYCSAPPVMIYLRPPCLTRNAEARRPRAPLQTPELKDVKAEISLIESIEDAPNCKPDIAFDCKPYIMFDPQQQSDPLQVSVAALAISSSIDEKSTAAAQGPSRFAERWGIRGQHLCHVPDGNMGPADPPRHRGSPKGSKSRPCVTFAAEALPERQEKVKAEERLANRASKRV